MAMRTQSRLGSRGWVAVALAVMGLASPAAADQFEAGSYIIPMDLDYQDHGMLRAYGLVYELLRSGVPVRWTIRPGKLYGEADFTAVTLDVATGAPIDQHAYRGGPFVVDASNAPEAADVIAAWQAQYPETTVHEAAQGFTADVARYLVVAPTIAMVADGNESIARGYMQAAGIPDSTLSLAWAAGSPDMLDIDELAGPTDTDHRDGALFDEDGDPVYCQLMSMHWGVGTAENNPEVVAEVREYLHNPVHFFAECQAVNAFENSIHGRFLTPNGFLIGQRPNEVDFLHMDSPFGQIDGPFTTIGGSEPAYSLPPGDSYKAGDITMLTQAGTAEGVNDVWMTGFLDGLCPPDQHECGTVGKVSYLGGHAYSTNTPMSSNANAQGVRMFLNSLFEAPCATVEGLPALGFAVDAPAQTTVPTVTFTVAYANTSFATALDAVIIDPLPPGATFVAASGGGMLVDDTVVWELGNLGPEESGDLTIEVELAAYGTYDNAATLEYRIGLNTFTLGSNVTHTVYAEEFGTSGDTAADGTADGGGTGGGSAAGTAGTADDTADGTRGGEGDGTIASHGMLDEAPSGCGCRTPGGSGGPGWLLWALPWWWQRRRRAALVGGGALVLAAGCGDQDPPPSGSGSSTGIDLTATTTSTSSADADETLGVLDVLPGGDVPFTPTSGCQKIDFLFVIDSSESMKAHQDELVASFPGFAAAMQDAVPAQDWHVMVVDTDGQWNGSDCANACLTLGTCPDEPAFDCGTPPPTLCDIAIGAGMVAPYGEGASNIDCGLGDRRYIAGGHPDLPGTFACTARVGVDGSSAERTAEALVRALSPERLGEGGCNEGFLRDDAILVVTLITDEPDDQSDGEPPAWYDAITTAKNGDDSAVVMLGLLPDADAAMPVCAAPIPAPRLSALLDAFPTSTRASVCEPDYSPFFAAAVDVIADTCEQFEPPA
jgi:uncharacterized repeat protein (TIGR01451 family)